MNIYNVGAYGVLSQLYDCAKGEGLPWHNHGPDQTHGHAVISGSTLVEIEGEESKTHKPGDGNIEFPVGKRHQITALEDGTRFINMMQLKPGQEVPAYSGPVAQPQPYRNRVMMADGTIVETD